MSDGGAGQGKSVSDAAALDLRWGHQEGPSAQGTTGQRSGRLEEGGRGEPAASMRTAGKTVGSQEGL